MAVSIYSQEETQERFVLRKFLCDHFVFHKDYSEHFTSPVAPNFLAGLYLSQFPNSCLTEDIIVHFILVGGYTTDPNRVFCDIKLETFLKLKDNVKLKLINAVDRKVSITLTQLTVHKALPEELIVFNDTEEIAALFMKHMVFNRDTTTAYNFMDLRKTCGYAIATDLYNYYNEFCAYHGFSFLSRKEFTNHLKSYKFEPIKGYCKGKSGVQYYSKFVIPVTQEDKLMSYQNFCGVVTLANSMLKIVPNFAAPIGEEAETLLVRVSGMNRKEWEVYEQRRKEATGEATKETTQIIPGGTIETTTSDVSGRAEKMETEINIRDNARLYTNNQEIIQVDKNEPALIEGQEYEDGYENISGDIEPGYDENGQNTDESSESYDTNDSPDGGYSFSDDESYQDGSANDADTDEFESSERTESDGEPGGSGEDVSGSSESLPTIEELIKGLKIPYMMDKDNFNTETLAFYLGIMNAPPEVYDDLPKLLQMLKEA